MTTGLIMSFIVACALGFAIRPFFYLGAAAFLATIAYLASLGYLHHLAIERAQKVVVLETRREMAIALDQARLQSGGMSVVARSRVGGTGWSVPDEELSDSRELVSVAR